MSTKITHDLPLGDPPQRRRDLDGAAQVAAIERRYGYSLRVPTAPADVRRTGPDAQLHASLETARRRILEHEATIHHLSVALAAAENRILALEQELSLLQSGPGEEDGPWAEGWDFRTAYPEDIPT